MLEDDSEDASADALDGEEASSGGVRLANVIRELRDRSNISLLLYDSESDQTLVSSARDVESCVTGCGAISSVMRGEAGCIAGI